MIMGNSNRAYLSQTGDNNLIDQELMGDGMNYTIIQNGNGNEVMQIENGMHSKAYEIIQTGNNMQVFIENGMTR